MEERRPWAHCHSAHRHQNAAGVIVNTPSTEITLAASSDTEMIANGSFHRRDQAYVRREAVQDARGSHNRFVAFPPNDAIKEHGQDAGSHHHREVKAVFNREQPRDVLPVDGMQVVV